MTLKSTYLESYLAKLPDSGLETELSKSLRRMSDEELRAEVFSAVENTESRRRISILRIATRASNNIEFFEELLDLGLRKRLVSEIGAWFELLIPKIGTNKIVERLFAYIGSDDEVVDIALYHLDGQVEGGDRPLLEKLRTSYLIQKGQTSTRKT